MLPDPIELMEMQAERLMGELEYSPQDDTMKCVECGNRCKIGEMMPSGPSPSAPPICQTCCPW